LEQENDNIRKSFGSVSLVRQGAHNFYSLTLPTDLLAKTCFVISREEDPIEGFQRLLDENRANEIAQYIDKGLGTIPSSIVLSAQDEAKMEYDSKRKSISFDCINKAFLIIDGQHRVYGFSRAKTAFRVPVVIYSGLSKKDETRLFIDINSKQKGVPPELLLDIKKLAEYENREEEFLRAVYDLFLEDPKSCLYRRLSPSSKSKGMLTRTTFNSSLKPLVKIFGNKREDEIFEILNNYLLAFDESILTKHDMHERMFNAIMFRAMCGFLPVVAARVKDRYGSIYTADNFYNFLSAVGERVKIQRLTSSGASYKAIISVLEDCLKEEFLL
jgi:DGQHR domain-containing protein